MVGGGGTINWSFIQHDLVDEVSMILAPVANGDPAAPRFSQRRSHTRQFTTHSST